MTSERNGQPDEAREQHMLHGSSSPDFLDASLEWRRHFAAAWGTFLLVLVAAGGSNGNGNGSGDDRSFADTILGTASGARNIGVKSAPAVGGYVVLAVALGGADQRRLDESGTLPCA